MRDTSLLAELEAENHKRKNKRKYYLLAIILLMISGAAGVSALVQDTQSKRHAQPALSSSPTTTESDITATPAQTQSQETTDQVATPPPVNTSAASPTVTMDEVNAKLCQDIIKGAQESANAYRDQ